MNIASSAALSGWCMVLPGWSDRVAGEIDTAGENQDECLTRTC
jgi:hypothetical protein